MGRMIGRDGVKVNGVMWPRTNLGCPEKRRKAGMVMGEDFCEHPFGLVSALSWLPADFVEADGWGKAKTVNVVCSSAARGQVSDQGSLCLHLLGAPLPLSAPGLPQSSLYTTLHPDLPSSPSPSLIIHPIKYMLSSEVNWEAFPAPLSNPNLMGRGCCFCAPCFLCFPNH